jgi:hypothetical protein
MTAQRLLKQTARLLPAAAARCQVRRARGPCPSPWPWPVLPLLWPGVWPVSPWLRPVGNGQRLAMTTRRVALSRH